jgi:small subunit ribosomal protein S6
MSTDMYELMFIMDVALAEDERREIQNEIEHEVIDLGGEVETAEQYDVRDLAYPINDITRGDYRLIRYEADGRMNQDLQERMNIRDDVLRYMIVKLDERDRRIFEESEESEESTESSGDEPEEEAVEDTADAT